MQDSKSSINNKKQCLVCYQQSRTLIKVCQNSHLICEKCVFNLRKRQCPICKIHFRVVYKKQRNQLRYEIMFGQEDREYDGIAVQEDVREQQEAIRNYQAYLQALQAYRSYYNNPYHHNQYHYGNHRNNGYLYNDQDYSNQRYMHPNYQPFLHAINNPTIHRIQQQQQSAVSLINHPNNHLINHQQNLHNPLDRRQSRQITRLQRRLRDQEMYRQNVRHQKQQQQSRIIRLQSEYKIIDKNNKDDGCGLLKRLGQFFISIGQRLTKTQTKHKGQAQQLSIQVQYDPQRQLDNNIYYRNELINHQQSLLPLTNFSNNNHYHLQHTPFYTHHHSPYCIHHPNHHHRITPYHNHTLNHNHHMYQNYYHQQYTHFNNPYHHPSFFSNQPSQLYNNHTYQSYYYG